MPWNKDGSRKTSTYKMKGSPHKMGTIEGTSAYKAKTEKKTHSTPKDDDPNYLRSGVEQISKELHDLEEEYHNKEISRRNYLEQKKTLQNEEKMLLRKLKKII
mgnify:CR=1